MFVCLTGRETFINTSKMGNLRKVRQKPDKKKGGKSRIKQR
jgi:hypothetical protein